MKKPVVIQFPSQSSAQTMFELQFNLWRPRSVKLLMAALAKIRGER